MLNVVKQVPPALKLAIDKVSELIQESPDSVLATVYRQVVSETLNSIQEGPQKVKWQEVEDLLNLSNDHDIAAEFRLWVNKGIDGTKINVKACSDFLRNVATGIVVVSRRS